MGLEGKSEAMSDPNYITRSILVRKEQSSTGEWLYDLWTAADKSDPRFPNSKKEARHSVNREIERLIMENDLVPVEPGVIYACREAKGAKLGGDI
jgi:hypothetical protein